ncbi:MAG: hypothetical protein QX197_00295 [Methylococcaceae bacterium]
MKRSHTEGMLSHHNLTSYKQRVAYHEAGHAVAIHANNSQKNLPPVFFQIIFKEAGTATNGGLIEKIDEHDCIARVEGWRLIQSLPITVEGLDGQSYEYFQHTDDYRLAFEADIINYLIGPLAEAKCSAYIDGEPFNQHLLSVHALKNYGGEADLAVVNDYLQGSSANKEEQSERLNQFFSQAYNFVNNNANWKAISKLANYILSSNKNKINCDEVALLLSSK